MCIYPGFESDVWDASLDRLRHEWFARLVAPDLACVHAGVFEHFSKEPSRIKSLGLRALEELVGSAFEANGFTIKLGSGKADEGIDLRLLEHSVYGDLITTVQVKSGALPVRLHYVQALAAAGDLDGAHESLFVSSSRFLPGVYKWVDRWNRERVRTVKLATAVKLPSGAAPLMSVSGSHPAFCATRYQEVLGRSLARS